MPISPRYGPPGMRGRMPGVVDCLDEPAAAVCAIAPVTNKIHTAAPTVLERFGLPAALLAGVATKSSRLISAPLTATLLALGALAGAGARSAQSWRMVGTFILVLATIRHAEIHSGNP